MFPIIDNIFKKRGIKSVADLTEEEKIDFNKLQRLAERLHTLETDVITVDGIVKFCKQEKEEVEKEWHNDPQIDQKKEIYLKVQHKIYDSLIKYIESPKAERQNIINYLESLSK